MTDSRRGAAGVKACMSNVGKASEYWRSHPASLFTVQKNGPHPQAVFLVKSALYQIGPVGLALDIELKM